MTVSAQLNELSEIPAFKDCSEEALERIRAEGSSVRFSIGHILSDASIVPNRALLLLSGKARLLGRHNGQLNTLAMLGPGTLVGLPSLLRAEGCEDVSAATAVIAWAIPDKLLAEIYTSESSFRSWCNSTVFPSELASLLNSLLHKTERAPFGLLDVLSKVMPVAKTFEGTEEAFQKLETNKQAFISSSNSSAELNSALEQDYSLPSSIVILGLRVIRVHR